jgi:hypothetical protein
MLTTIKEVLIEFIKLIDAVNIGSLDIVLFSSLVDQNGSDAFIYNNNNQTKRRLISAILNSN